MKIREIEVNRFRIWRNLDLPLKKSGLSVVYGPNEAGKSTLMRFVRAVLYGFEPEDQLINHSGEDAVPWQGSLKVSADGNNYRIRRTADRVGRGSVRVSSRGLSAADKKNGLADFLFGVDERVFEDIFAIGLKEIQQLATMDSKQVADRIYGMSMGPAGNSLLTALSDLQTLREQTLSPDGGRLNELFSRYQQVASTDRSSANRRERHAELTRERESLEARLKSFKQRQSIAAANLRGNEHLLHCHSPWKRVRELSKELESLPLVNEVAADIFDRSDNLDRQVSESEHARDRIVAELDQLNKQLGRMNVDPEIERNAATLRSFVDQADWLRDIDTQINTIDTRLAGSQHEVERAVQELGGSWTVARLEAVDASPEANVRLLHVAREYQAAMTRRSRLRRLNRKMSKSSQQELVALEERVAELNGVSIDEAVESERRRLRELEDLGRLKLRDAELQLHGTTIQRIVSRVDVNQSLPEWIDWIFNFFGVAGFILFFVGIVFAASADAALAGAAISFAGLMWVGFRSGLQNHFSKQTAIKLDDLHREADEAESELKAVRSQVQRLTNGSTSIALLNQESTSTDEDIDKIRHCVQRIVDLEQLAADQQRIYARRQKLTLLRDKFRTAQHNVNEQRQRWCETLKSIGLDETIRIDEGFATWQRVLDANDILRQWQMAAPEAESYRRTWKSMQDRIAAVGKRMPKTKLNLNQPMEVLSAWSQQLKVLDRDQGQREGLQTEHLAKERRIRELQLEIDELKSEKAGMLARAGAVSREELIQRQEWLDLRRELEIELAEARRDLESVTASEPNLAIVEDDLLTFDARQCDEEITLARMELEEIEEQLEPSIERLGSVKTEIAALEDGRESIKADFERGRLAGEIHRTAESLFALKYAERVVDEMRTRFESSSISTTLALASEYLELLTQGRYHRIWAPLGKHHLCVDDGYDRSFQVEELSGGTREQLFVAIRMALIREFSDRGIELPMVMDDLFVNFDQERTEAAVDTLIEFANSGQQVLFFTCHLHLARLFESRKVKTLWLPGHTDGDLPPKGRRKKTRRARTASPASTQQSAHTSKQKSPVIDQQPDSSIDVDGDLTNNDGDDWQTVDDRRVG